jgi:hypothetical protein
MLAARLPSILPPLSLAELAEGARIKSCDPGMPPISGSRSDAAADIDHRAAGPTRPAARRARRRPHHPGRSEGPWCEGRQGKEWLGGFFRRCLEQFAEILGFATKGAHLA